MVLKNSLRGISLHILRAAFPRPAVFCYYRRFITFTATSISIKRDDYWRYDSTLLTRRNHGALMSCFLSALHDFVNLDDPYGISASYFNK